MDSPNEKEVNPLNTTEDEMNKRHASGDLVSSESILHSNQPHFQFVESIEKPVARSHAMKTYWRRKKGEQQQEEYLKPNQPSLRPLRPLSKPRAVHEPETSTLLSPTEEASSGHGYLSCSVKSPEELGIPDQLFANISFTFACVLGQKVEANSFQISAHHHRFFYHCECVFNTAALLSNIKETDSSIFLFRAEHACAYHTFRTSGADLYSIHRDLDATRSIKCCIIQWNLGSCSCRSHEI